MKFSSGLMLSLMLIFSGSDLWGTEDDLRFVATFWPENFVSKKNPLELQKTTGWFGTKLFRSSNADPVFTGLTGKRFANKENFAAALIERYKIISPQDRFDETTLKQEILSNLPFGEVFTYSEKLKPRSTQLLAIINDYRNFEAKKWNLGRQDNRSLIDPDVIKALEQIRYPRSLGGAALASAHRNRNFPIQNQHATVPHRAVEISGQYPAARPTSAGAERQAAGLASRPPSPRPTSAGSSPAAKPSPRGAQGASPQPTDRPQSRR